ncbi:MAG: M16 family metallopeptidase [Rubripirellula sp.]
MPEFRETTLPNGLRIAAEIDGRGYSAALGYFVRAGSRDEVDSESGLSHFLEHMMFKGTERRSAADVNRELDELGGQSNAYTSEEQTVYYATVLPKFQDRIVDLLTDMLSPALDEQEFETERQVILEEIAKYEDQPPFGAFERAMEVHYGPRGLGRRILGTAESIRTMNAATMRDYFHRRYRPENIVLAASGNIDFDGLVAEVQQRTADWSDRPNTQTPSEDDIQSVPAGISLEPTIEIPDANQAYLVRIAPGPNTRSEDRYAARVLASILGDEGGSRLFWELIDSGRAEVATVWPHEFIDAGAWFTYMVCAPEDAATNRRLIDDIVQRTIDSGADAEELSQTISKATAGCIMQSERPSNRLFGLGSRWLTCGEYLSTDDTLDRLRGIELDDVAQAARTYLGSDSSEIVASAQSLPTAG